MEDYHYNLVLFREIKRFILYRNQLGTFAVFSNLFGNILIFMPYGYFLTMAGKRKSFFRTLFYSMGLSLGVEVMQLLTKVGHLSFSTPYGWRIFSLHRFFLHI